jgi:hypothetical protein
VYNGHGLSNIMATHEMSVMITIVQSMYVISPSKSLQFCIVTQSSTVRNSLQFLETPLYLLAGHWVDFRRLVLGVHDALYHFTEARVTTDEEKRTVEVGMILANVLLDAVSVR